MKECEQICYQLYADRIDALNELNEELKEELLNHKSLIWYIYCGSEDNLAEEIIGEYYNCKNDSDKKYLKNFWKKIYNLEQTEGRIKRDKLKQVLQEIKDMCKKHTDFCKDNKKNCELCSLEPCNDILILQKISEVENE